MPLDRLECGAADVTDAARSVVFSTSASPSLEPHSLAAGVSTYTYAPNYSSCATAPAGMPPSALASNISLVTGQPSSTNSSSGDVVPLHSATASSSIQFTSSSDSSSSSVSSSSSIPVNTVGSSASTAIPTVTTSSPSTGFNSSALPVSPSSSSVSFFSSFAANSSTSVSVSAFSLDSQSQPGLLSQSLSVPLSTSASVVTSSQFTLPSTFSSSDEFNPSVILSASLDAAEPSTTIPQPSSPSQSPSAGPYASSVLNAGGASPTGTSGNTSSSDRGQTSSAHRRTVIAGGVVGGILGFALLMVGVALLVRRRAPRRQWRRESYSSWIGNRIGPSPSAVGLMADPFAAGMSEGAWMNSVRSSNPLAPDLGVSGRINDYIGIPVPAATDLTDSMSELLGNPPVSVARRQYAVSPLVPAAVPLPPTEPLSLLPAGATSETTGPNMYGRASPAFTMVPMLTPVDDPRAENSFRDPSDFPPFPLEPGPGASPRSRQSSKASMVTASTRRRPRADSIDPLRHYSSFILPPSDHHPS